MIDENEVSLSESTPLPNETESARAISMSYSMSYAGPLPTPDLLMEYERALPGSAQMIIDMALKEQENRHKAEFRAIQEEGRYRAVGLAVGVVFFVVVITLLILGSIKGANFLVLLTPVISLLGGVLGFYFGKSHSDVSPKMLGK